MTEDLDILYQPSPENGKKLLDSLSILGYDINSFLNHDFTKPTHFRLGEVPNTIDLINDITGVDLNTVFSRGINLKVQDLKVPVISIEDLITNKKALNTYKDLADAEMLIKIKERTDLR